MSHSKHVLLAILAIFVTIQGYAQHSEGFGFGVRLGSNFADYNNSNGKSRAGLYTGAMIDYNFNKHWGLETGLYYSQQGNSDNAESGYVNTEEGYKNGRTDHLMDYLSLPVSLKFTILGGFRVYGSAQVAYLMSARRRINNVNGSAIERMSRDDVNSVDLSAQLGVGYGFKFGLDLTASYSWGFYDVLLNTPKHNSTNIFRVAVGWRFGCHKK